MVQAFKLFMCAKDPFNLGVGGLFTGIVWPSATARAVTLNAGSRQSEQSRAVYRERTYTPPGRHSGFLSILVGLQQHHQLPEDVMRTRQHGMGFT